MKVLIINAILYTSETADIKRVNSIKDTMFYDLCLAFKALGAEPVLFAAEPYKPVNRRKLSV
jgi:1,2-diacylglycerol 3-alpha-glucosyltransferase